MEVFAGFAEHVDIAGRSYLWTRSTGSDTATTRSSSTSGATTDPGAEGQTAPSASCSRRTTFRRPSSSRSKPSTILGGFDVLGSPKTDNMYHAGWSWAAICRSDKSTKLIASHFGGTRNPMASLAGRQVSNPTRTPRSQFHHVNDVVPTIYEIRRHHAAAGSDGIHARPVRRRQLREHVRRCQPRRLTRSTSNHGELVIYHDGWFAGAFGPRMPGFRVCQRASSM